MRKIVFFTGSMVRGGAERVIRNLSCCFDEKGYKVEIANVLTDETEYELPESIKVVDCSSGNGNRFDASDKIVRYIKETKPDIVFVFMWQISLIFGAALKKIKNRNFYLIMSERNDPRRPFKRRLLTPFVNAQYKKADVVVFQTKSAKKRFPKSIKDKSVIIPNVVEVGIKAEEHPQKKIVSIGRLEPQKNQKLLIRAFGSFVKTHCDYVLEIFGEGRLRCALEKLINDLGLKDKVFLKGNVSDVHEQIKDAEFFVLSSNYEGLSNALMEAMAMGLPVISTDYDGSEEYIKDGFNGLLTKKGNEQALVNAMCKLADDGAIRKAIGGNAEKTVDCLKIDNVMQKWFSLIDNCDNGEKA